MFIIGCDCHPSFQQIAFVDTESGELGERRLAPREEAEQFYRQLKEQDVVRVGVEASGHSRRFERLLRRQHRLARPHLVERKPGNRRRHTRR